MSGLFGHGVCAIEPCEECRADRIGDRVARWAGWQERPGHEPVGLWTLLRDVGPHPAGSTVSTRTLRTLRALGYEAIEPGDRRGGGDCIPREWVDGFCGICGEREPRTIAPEMGA